VSARSAGRLVRVHVSSLGTEATRTSTALAILGLPMTHLARMYEWFDEEGCVAYIPTLREEYPDLTTFEQYLRQSR
jgi:hypothetical protein